MKSVRAKSLTTRPSEEGNASSHDRTMAVPREHDFIWVQKLSDVEIHFMTAINYSF